MGNKLTYPEVDLTGKVALVTGANTGIGYQTAKAFARLGAHTFIACRSKERAENAIAQMKKELLRSQPTTSEDGASKTAANEEKSEEPASGEDKPTEDSENPTAAPREEEVRSKEERGGQQSEAATGKKDIKIEYLPLDLGSFQSTKECVRLFKERDLPLHILVNNAAILGNLFTKTTDDLECQFQVNHLGPTLLTLELLPILVETASACGDVRIVFLTSSGHFMAEEFNPETFNRTEENYKRFKQYCNTKLYNVMTGYCLQRRLQNNNITISSVHPGYVRTELDRSVNDMKVVFAIHSLVKNVVRTPVEGAATTLNCAVNPDLNSQQHFYYDSCKTKVPSIPSRNEEFQEQMWKKTFEFLKDHLSPETIEKYGPKEVEETTQTAEATETVPVQDKDNEPPQKEEEGTKEGEETTQNSDAASKVESPAINEGTD